MFSAPNLDKSDEAVDEQIQQLLRSQKWKVWYSEQQEQRFKTSERRQKLLIVANRLPTTVSR